MNFLSIIKADTYRFVGWKQATASFRFFEYVIKFHFKLNFVGNFQNCRWVVVKRCRAKRHNSNESFASNTSCVICLKLEQRQTSSMVFPWVDIFYNVCAHLCNLYYAPARSQVFRMLFMQHHRLIYNQTDRIDSMRFVSSLCSSIFSLFFLNSYFRRCRRERVSQKIDQWKPNV